MTVYKYMPGMKLQYKEGHVEEFQDESTRQNGICYTVTFLLPLDFKAFRDQAEALIPGYLTTPENAIRPELEGLTYHYSYNYLINAVPVDSADKLFSLFTAPSNYFDGWATGNGIKIRYSKPEFSETDEGILITAQRWFLHELAGKEHDFVISDLPLLRFDWALHLFVDHQRRETGTPLAPGSVAWLGYCLDEWTEVHGVKMRKGMRYIVGSELKLGSIPASAVRIA